MEDAWDIWNNFIKRKKGFDIKQGYNKWQNNIDKVQANNSFVVPDTLKRFDIYKTAIQSSKDFTFINYFLIKIDAKDDLMNNWITKDEFSQIYDMLRSKIGCKLGLCYSVYHTNIHLHDVISYDTLMLFWESAIEDHDDGYMDNEELNQLHTILYNLCPEFAFEQELDRVPRPGDEWISANGRVYSFEPTKLIVNGEVQEIYSNHMRWEYVKTL